MLFLSSRKVCGRPEGCLRPLQGDKPEVKHSERIASQKNFVITRDFKDQKRPRKSRLERK